MDKISRSEANRLGLKRYYTGKPCEYGHAVERLVCSWGCVECNKIRSRKFQSTRSAQDRAEAMQRWRSKNPEKTRADGRRLYASNRIKRCAESRKYRAENPEKVLLRGRKWQAENPEKAHAATRRWVAANPIRVKSGKAARRASERSAVPAWVDKVVLQEIYAKASREGMQVDHIIPLNHPLVCGLHVPWNLQLLTKFENCSKGNRFEIGV